MARDALIRRLAGIQPPCDLCEVRDVCAEGELTCSFFRAWAAGTPAGRRGKRLEIGEDILTWADSWPAEPIDEDLEVIDGLS